MKEYVYRDMECLVDLEGNPIRVYIPKDEIEQYDELCMRARESGMRFRKALQLEGVI